MTRLFDVISRHGHRISEKRARRDPQFNADWEARRVEPGVVLGTEGPGGLDGLFKEMEDQRKHDPWWLTVSLHIHWWMGDHGPRATRSKIRRYHQRGKRGWGDRDTWNLDHYLSTIIRDSVQHLKGTTHGYPGTPDVPTFEDWKSVLDEISDGMQSHLTLSDILITSGMSDQEITALEASRDLAFDHLKNHWGSLWD